MRETRKVGRFHRDRKRRKAVKDKEKPARRIVRGDPPKKHKKVVATQEMVRNPKTGKMEYKDVYKVTEVRDPVRDKHLEKTLYIPKVAPEKERRYLRYVPPQFRDASKRYENPNRYGDLSLYKKSRIMQIAKDKYDLTDKLAKHLDKDDLIKYIKKRYKKADTFRDEDYLPQKIKLRKVEPIRTKHINYQPNRGFDASVTYGKGGANNLIGHASLTKSAFEDLNEKLDANPLYSNIPKFGQFRKMSEIKYKRFLEGKLPKEDMQSELLTHLKIEDPSIIITLDDKQLTKLYKKAYKMSKKPDEEKFSKSINFPKFKQNNSGNFGKAPVIRDPTGKPFIVGTRDINMMTSPISNPHQVYNTRDIFGESYEQIRLKEQKYLKDWMNNQNKEIRKYNKKMKHGQLDLLTFKEVKQEIEEIMKDELVPYEEAVKRITSTNAF